MRKAGESPKVFKEGQGGKSPQTVELKCVTDVAQWHIGTPEELLDVPRKGVLKVNVQSGATISGRPNLVPELADSA